METGPHDAGVAPRPQDPAFLAHPLWRALLDTALDSVIAMDHLGRVLDLNRAAEQTFGWPRDAAIGQDLADLIIPPGLRAAHRGGMERYLATGEGPVLGARVEVSALHAEGHEFAVELAVSRLPAQEPPVFIAYLRDIDARRRTEKLRTLRAEAMQAMARADTAQAAGDGVLHAFCDVLGWELGFVWQREGDVLRCQRHFRFSPGIAPDFVDASLDLSLVRGTGLPGLAWETRAPVWRRDVTVADNFPRAPVARRDGVRAGVACPVMIGGEVVGAIEFYSEHIREPDADLLETLSIVCAQLGQVWQRSRAEAALRHSESMLKLLADTIPQLAWMADPAGNVFWYNQRWYHYTGATPEAMRGEGWTSVHDPEVLPTVIDRWKQALADGTPFEMVFPLRAADGAFRPFLTRMEPLRDDNGQILYWFGTNTDISAIRSMEDALRDADRRKDEFLAMLAHELRNPLAPISTALAILGAPQAADAAREQARQVIGRQVDHLVRLVDDLLDVSRFIRGRMALQRDATELRSLVDRAVEMALPAMRAKDHRLDVRLPPTPVVLDVDGVRIVQAIGNLLTNAARYTGHGGHVSLAAAIVGEAVEIRVRDSGVGLDPSMLDAVFDLFVQAGDGSTQGGLGIGLTLARQLARMHGGDITAASDGPGRGAEFVLTLPLPQRAMTPGRAAAPGAAPAPVDVLVVDDNHDAAESLALLLQLEGHTVRTCSDGPSALAAVAERAPQLVLLDLGMPGMDGYEVARRLRSGSNARMLIVALTGWGQQADRDRTRDAGFDCHHVKPIPAEALRALLAKATSTTPGDQGR